MIIGVHFPLILFSALQFCIQSRVVFDTMIVLP